MKKDTRLTDFKIHRLLLEFVADFTEIYQQKDEVPNTDYQGMQEAQLMIATAKIKALLNHEEVSKQGY